MYDPKFEKAVQQKMEELEFRPSESVWVNIEKAVSGERRRRVIPYFWRWLAPALMLTGIAGAWYLGERAGRRMVVATPAGQVVSTGKKTGAPADRVQGAPATGLQDDQVTMVRPALSGAPRHTPATVENRVWSGAGKSTSSKAGNGSADALVEGAATGMTAGGMEGQGSAAAQRIEPYLYNPDLDGRRIAPRVSAAAPVATRNIGSLNTLSRPKRPWEAGFTAGGGIDHLTRLNAGQGNIPSAAFSGLSNFGFFGGARTNNSISDIRPDASFDAGIYLQKPVSSRWTFNTGLDLHYYSTRISIGQQLNTNVPSSASLINAPSAIAVAQAPVVYTVGNQQTYTNRYYMVELPVGMQYRINHSPMLPLFLEGGFSLSRLMGTNALFYNPSTGLYLKNENSLNKTQFDLSSALMIGLPFHGIRIMAGPQVQYGLTRLLNTQSLGDQHFFYTGLRIVVLPGRR